MTLGKDFTHRGEGDCARETEKCVLEIRMFFFNTGHPQQHIMPIQIFTKNCLTFIFSFRFTFAFLLFHLCVLFQ